MFGGGFCVGGLFCFVWWVAGFGCELGVFWPRWGWYNMRFGVGWGGYVVLGWLCGFRFGLLCGFGLGLGI